MNYKRIRIFAGGGLLTLALMRPNLPVIAGTALLMLVGLSVERDLSDPSPANRRAAFKRLLVASALGIALAAAGLAVGGAGWPARIGSPSEARHAMLVLAAYASAVLAAPFAAWQMLAFRQPRRRQRMFVSPARPQTLREIAHSERFRGTRVAV